MEKVTQAVIAQKAGVSQSAVSFVLNRKNNIQIPEATQRKIFQAVEELKYTPRFVLAETGSRTQNIGYLIPDTSHSSFIVHTYYHRFFDGIGQAIKERDYNLILVPLKKGKDLTAVLEKRKFDGLIIEKPVEPKLLTLASKILPLVLLNLTVDGVGVDSVMPDNFAGIKKVVTYLYKYGHRRIAFLGMKPLDSIHASERVSGYIEALKDFGLPKKEEYLKLPERRKGGEKELLEFATAALKDWLNLPQPPTAVVTMNDIYAISLLHAALQLGISIPGQLSVTGYDNTDLCFHSHPPLTSVNQPMEEMAKTTCDLLFSRIENPARLTNKSVLDVELVERDSTGSVPGKDQ